MAAEGIKHDQGKPRMGLLAPRWLLGVSQVLTFGAKKYTKYGECTCHARYAEAIRSSLLECAEIVMRDSSNSGILSTPRISDEIIESGLSEILRGFESTQHGERLLQLLPRSSAKSLKDCLLNIRSQSSKLNEFLADSNAISAEARLTFGSTTTIRQERLEVDFATRVISISDGSKKSPGLIEHLSTCGTHLVVRAGVHNWAKGLPYSKIYDGIQRHLNAFWDREDNDPESGLSHILHGSCGMMFLYMMTLMRPDLDDRYREEGPKSLQEIKDRYGAKTRDDVQAGKGPPLPENPKKYDSLPHSAGSDLRDPGPATLRTRSVCSTGTEECGGCPICLAKIQLRKN